MKEFGYINFIFSNVFFVKIIFDLLSLAFVCSLAIISSRNPFQNHFIRNISDYYYSDPNSYLNDENHFF